MELRWYQTYDENGVYSEKTLQYCNRDGWYPNEWIDIPFVRERKLNEDD